MKHCDYCNITEKDQAIISHDEENLCLDCMRLSGCCISCGKYIPLLVDDYYTYESDDCPECEEANLLK